MNKKILVTGAGGYIGSVAAYLLLQNDYEVIAIDNFSTGYRQPLEILQNKFGESKLRFYEADLKDDFSSIFEKESFGCAQDKPCFDAVLHYAASCLVDESMKKPEKYFENNILSSLNLLNNLVKYHINNIIFSSTAAVYGEAKYVPIDEKHLCNPINVYGESKLIVENMIKWFGRLKEIKYLIFRYFNVCGASDDGLIGDAKKPSTLLVQNAVRGVLGIESFHLTYPEVDTVDKTPIRDYVNVVDLNEAHIQGLQYLLSNGQSEIINLGTETGNSVLEVVDKVQKTTGVKLALEKTTPREGDPAKLIASVEKAKRILGWQPKRTIEDSVNSLIKWYKSHPKGWSK